MSELERLRRLATEIPAHAFYLAELESVTEGITDSEEINSQFELVAVPDGVPLGVELALRDDLGDLLTGYEHYVSKYALYRKATPRLRSV